MLLVFDVDGTLAPLVARPDRARVPGGTLRLLRRATEGRNVSVAVLSARTGRELSRLVPVRGIRKIAHYGIGSIVAVPASRRKTWMRRAKTIAQLLEGAARGHGRARVERKGISVALHDRGVASGALRTLRRALRPVVAAAHRAGFEPVRGARVTEFVPRGHGKARALRALLSNPGTRGAKTVFYWGDSEGDEPAFAMLAGRHVSIKVGPGPTRARYRVVGPREAARFLASVVRARCR